MPLPYCDPDTCPTAGCVPALCVGAGMPSNAAMFERSCEAIPGGVNSSIRAFRAVGGTPYVVARAEAAHVWDVSGRPTEVQRVSGTGGSALTESFV